MKMGVCRKCFTIEAIDDFLVCSKCSSLEITEFEQFKDDDYFRRS